ncbi:MAG: hypothetical protein ACRENO_08235, partial [Thermodesulfobacteriota bacterium]
MTQKLEDKNLEKRIREIADYFMNWDYPSRSAVDVIEELGNDILTLKALAVLQGGNFITMGHIGNAKSVYGKYFSLVNPETNQEMEAEMCFN